MFAYSQVCFLSSPPHSKSRDWKALSPETGTDSAFLEPESIGVECKLHSKIKGQHADTDHTDLGA